jgi:deoxyhypusine synthase
MVNYLQKGGEAGFEAWFNKGRADDVKNEKDWQPDKFSSQRARDIQEGLLETGKGVDSKRRFNQANKYRQITLGLFTNPLAKQAANRIMYNANEYDIFNPGAIEEDIMKSLGEEFELTNFNADDTALHEKGENRVGNIIIHTSGYMKFEDKMNEFLTKIYEVIYILDNLK